MEKNKTTSYTKVGSRWIKDKYKRCDYRINRKYFLLGKYL